MIFLSPSTTFIRPRPLPSILHPNILCFIDYILAETLNSPHIITELFLSWIFNDAFMVAAIKRRAEGNNLERVRKVGFHILYRDVS